MGRGTSKNKVLETRVELAERGTENREKSVMVPWVNHVGLCACCRSYSGHSVDFCITMRV